MLIMAVESGILISCTTNEMPSQNRKNDVSITNYADQYKENQKLVPAESFIEEVNTETISKSVDMQEIEDIANRFAKVYFGGNADILKQYLVEPYVWEVETYQNSDSSDKMLITDIKGLSDIGEKNIGDVCVIYIEYKESEIDDMYKYLTIEFIKEEMGWKIQFYGIEG